MDLKRLTPTLSVAPQIAPDDLPAAAAAGFTTLICNRPDGEQPGQPDPGGLTTGQPRHGMRDRKAGGHPGQRRADPVAEHRQAVRQEMLEVQVGVAGRACGHGALCLALGYI